MPVSEGGFKDYFDTMEDLVKRDRAAAKGELTDIRVGNSDGTPITGDFSALAAIATLFKKGGGRGNRSKDSGDSRRRKRTSAEIDAEVGD